MILSIENKILRCEREDSFALIYIIKGAAPVQIGSRCHVIAAPFCICLNEKESFIPGPEELEGITVLFHPSHLNSALTFHNLSGDKTGLPESAVLDRYFLRPFVERDRFYGGVFAPGPETDIVIRSRMARLCADCADTASPFWLCRRRSALMELLMLIVSSYRAGTPSAPDTFGSDELCTRVASWLTVHYSEKVTVGELCRIFDINRTDLSERFRRAAGVSLIDYLSRVRIDMACRLLRETKLPSGEILYRAGFNDAAHFSRTFRKFMKMSPSAYRGSFPAEQ
ncbi:MAG: helix-turn-helix domain-containing protein [Spirochaetota bacterium]